MTKRNGYDDDFGNDRDDNFRFRDDDDHRSDNDHKHDDGNDDNYVHRDGTLDSHAVSPSGGMYWGSTDTPLNYEIADNRSEHLELGLKVHVRQGPDSPVVTDPHDVAHYNEDPGTQPGNATRATWNFDYSVNTLLGGGHGKIDQFDFKMTLSENNPAPGGAHHTETFDLHPTVVVGTTTFHNVWVSESNPAHTFGGTDDNVPPSLTSSQAQNSVNVAFHAFDDFGTIAQRTAAGTQWDVKLTALEHHEVVAQVHDVINIVAHDLIV
jgi:hypothetical protein